MNRYCWLELAITLLLTWWVLVLNRRQLRMLKEAQTLLLWRNREIAALKSGTPHFACPRCGAVSYNVNDLRYGWCGKCKDYTGANLT